VVFTGDTDYREVAEMIRGSWLKVSEHYRYCALDDIRAVYDLESYPVDRGGGLATGYLSFMLFTTGRGYTNSTSGNMVMTINGSHASSVNLYSQTTKAILSSPTTEPDSTMSLLWTHLPTSEPESI
jgi:hypothetical protein